MGELLLQLFAAKRINLQVPRVTDIVILGFDARLLMIPLQFGIGLMILQFGIGNLIIRLLILIGKLARVPMLVVRHVSRCSAVTVTIVLGGLLVVRVIGNHFYATVLLIKLLMSVIQKH